MEASAAVTAGGDRRLAVQWERRDQVPHEVEFRILGPLEVRVDGRRVAVPGARQRALLCALLQRPGEVVPPDRLIDDVFGETPPAEARNALQTYVTRLRQALGPAADVIVTRPPGYLVDLSRATVDAARFADLLAKARAAETATAALALVEQALALWHGSAFAEFADRFARPEALRLEELRLAAREDGAALLLHLDRVAEATAALDALVAEQPWRERAVELLITSLARSGRTVEALAAYRRYRDRLRDDLGLDPSPALRQLEQQVLRGQLQPERRKPLAPARRALPTRVTSLVGRDRELAAIRGLLSDGRLVTLVGPGGVGKTRLAHEVAAAEQDPWWVDLAALRDGEAVPSAVADAVGLDVQPGSPLLDTLRGWARSATGLLVLDNCEHLLPSVSALVEELLAASSALRMLATSRERLAVDGEQVFAVSPLEVPEPGASDPLRPAVQLFLDRARAADPHLVPDRRLLQRAGEVVRALDGLPLAIELAAARVGTLTVDDLADRLDARFELLRQTRGGGDPRHHTLRAVVDWSFDLLTTEEQRLLLRLSVFAAAFDLTTVEAILADGDLPAQRIADLIARLTGRSMLIRPGPVGVGRYRMLETLRSYAAFRLPPADADRLRRRLAAFLVDLTERAERGLYSADEQAWVQRIELWLDDVRTTWIWARDAGETDIAVRLAAALTRFAYWRLRSDLLAWGTWAVETVLSHPRLSVTYAAAAHAAWIEGRLAEARSLAGRGIAVAGGASNPAAAAALEASGDAALLSGDLTGALQAYRATATVATSTDDPAALAIAAANEAIVLSYADDPQAAATSVGAVAAALASNNPTAIAYSLFAEGEALADDDPERAVAALDEARRRAQDVGNPVVAGVALNAAVALRGRRGPPDQALALFREAIGHWRASGNRALIVTTLRNLVVLLARVGQDEPAAVLAATLEHAAPAKTYGAEAERIATALAAARQRLGDAAYARAWNAGGRRTLEEATDQAMQLLAEHGDGSQVPG
jgi:predicted ATPase/DNA-binding SARP family transcriptional activator